MNSVRAFGNLAHFRDQRAAGTAGGELASGAWRTRTIQTTIVNNISGASLASNQITLPAGTYTIQAWGAYTGVNEVKQRFFNTTSSTDLVIGNSDFVAAVATRGHGHLFGVFTLAASGVCEFQARCSTTRSGDGFGTQANIDSKAEVYADVMIYKVD
jgi:hypothetical protein